MSVRALVAGVAALFLAGCDSVVTKPSLYGSVRVQVTRRDGTGIANIPLTLYSGERRFGYGATGADGWYQFEFVPEGRYGVFAGLISGYTRLEALIPIKPTGYVEELRVTPGGVATATFEMLKEGPGTITVITTEPDGNPVSGATVSLYTGAGTAREVTADPSGLVTFNNVPFGNWGVSVLRSARYLDSAEAPFVSRDGIIVDDGFRNTVRVTLHPCLGTVSSSVRDDAGSPVAGARFVLYSSHSALDSAVSDSTGSNQFRQVVCGNYGVSLASAPIGWSLVAGRGFHFADGLWLHRDGTRTAALRVLRVTCRGALRVRVTETSGAAVAGAELVVYTGSVAYRRDTTGADGLRTFADLPCDRQWGVYVTPPPTHAISAAAGPGFYDTIKLTSGETADRTFTLVRR